jgi:hypothetical protein
MDKKINFKSVLYREYDTINSDGRKLTMTGKDIFYRSQSEHGEVIHYLMNELTNAYNNPLEVIHLPDWNLNDDCSRIRAQSYQEGGII